MQLYKFIKYWNLPTPVAGEAYIFNVRGRGLYSAALQMLN